MKALPLLVQNLWMSFMFFKKYAQVKVMIIGQILKYGVKFIIRERHD